MGISIDALLRQVRSLFDLEVLMMKYKLFNCIYRIGYNWWNVISWVYEDGWLYWLDYIVCCSYTLFYFGDDVLLVLGLVSMNVNFKSNRAVLFYNVGLNLTAIMLVVVRGIVQVLGLNVVSAAISGIAGIGHIILGVSLILILLDIKKSV